MIDRDIHTARALLVEGNAMLRSVAAEQLRSLGIGHVAQASRVRDARLLIERKPTDAVRERSFDAQACHRHAVQHFSALAMARGYLEKYARILDGEILNPAAPAMSANPKSLPWLK